MPGSHDLKGLQPVFIHRLPKLPFSQPSSGKCPGAIRFFVFFTGAKWVLSASGSVVMRCNDEKHRKALWAVPHNGFFYLVVLSLNRT
jgi:hypothetical protein